MKLERCKNGHFFDADKFNMCPHCEDVGAVDPGTTQAFTEDVEGTTRPVDESPTAPEPIDLDNQKTIGFWGTEIAVEPVVGWLVCIEGENIGEDYKLKSGSNYIGRGNEFDVNLSKDKAVNRDKQGEIVYDPMSRKFHVLKGSGSKLYYLNDDPVYSPMEIQRNDTLKVGKSRLMFFPCCDDNFSWKLDETEE